MFLQAAAGLAPVYSGIELYRALPEIPAGAPIYSIATYDQTLPFYWRRTVGLVAYRGELDFGLERNPAAEEPSIDRFVDRWRAEPDAYAVMDLGTFAMLTARGVPMRKIAHDINRVLVSRR
jgi:hypothetical protein